MSNIIITSALKPVITCSAPASRSLASSANKSIQISSANRIQLPIILDFHSDDGQEKIRGWYRSQPTTQVTSIEYRKDTVGHFKHEFIVAHLDNSTICRFDRRACEDMRGHALKDEGTISEDSAHVITQADTESRDFLDQSEVLLRIDLPEKQNLKYILTVCHGIQSHPRAKSYSLLYYNCYFFSWTLFMTIVRRSCKWVVDSELIWRCVRGRLLSTINYCEHALRYSNSNTMHSILLFVGTIWGSISTQPEVYIYRSIGDAIRGYSPDIPMDNLETLLFRTQLSPVLKKEISTIVLKGCQDGEKQYTTNTEASSFYKTPAPLGWNKEVLENEDVLPGPGGVAPPLGTDFTGWSISQKRAWERAHKVSVALHDDLIRRISWDIMSALSICLPDPTFTSGGEKASSLIVITLEGSKNSSESLEDYIQQRMKVHFEQVQSYGFGNAEELIDRAEKSMIEIWESVVGMMRDESQLPFV